VKTVQNGKGDRPRNNWGPKWYAGYAAIDWHCSDGANEKNRSQLRTAAPRPILPDFVNCKPSQR